MIINENQQLFVNIFYGLLYKEGKKGQTAVITSTKWFQALSASLSQVL